MFAPSRSFAIPPVQFNVLHAMHEDCWYSVAELRVLVPNFPSEAAIAIALENLLRTNQVRCAVNGDGQFVYSLRK